MVKLLLSLVLLATLALGQFSSPGIMQPLSSAAGYVLKDSFEGYDGVTGSAQAYIANRFDASATYTAKKIGVWIYRNAGDTSDYSVEIWSNGSSQPGSVLESVTVANASVPTSGAWLEVELPVGVSISSGTTYWVVTVKQTPNASTLNWGRGNTTVEHMMQSTDGSTWTDLTITRAGNFRSYAYE